MHYITVYSYSSQDCTNLGKEDSTVQKTFAPPLNNVPHNDWQHCKVLHWPVWLLQHSDPHVPASSGAQEGGQDIKHSLSGHNGSRLKDFASWINFQSVKVCPASGTWCFSVCCLRWVENTLVVGVLYKIASTLSYIATLNTHLGFYCSAPMFYFASCLQSYYYISLFMSFFPMQRWNFNILL